MLLASSQSNGYVVSYKGVEGKYCPLFNCELNLLLTASNLICKKGFNVINWITKENKLTRANAYSRPQKQSLLKLYKSNRSTFYKSYRFADIIKTTARWPQQSKFTTPNTTPRSLQLFLFIYICCLLLRLSNYNDLVAPRLSFCTMSVCISLGLLWVPCSSSAHRAPGEKAAVPICKVLVRPG